MRHPNEEMIKAKAENMDLVIFVRHTKTEWVEAGFMALVADKSAGGYFLCLPKHKEVTLHWLNGGDVLVKEFNDQPAERLIEGSGFSGWHDATVFMAQEAKIRIKPRKEKRWIVAKPSALVSMMYFNSNSDAECAIKNSTGEFKGGQVIEIEVDV